MKAKLVYIGALFALLLASASAANRKAGIQMVYRSEPNGDYRLYIFGSERALVCEEKTIKIIDQGDAVNPLVLECKH